MTREREIAKRLATVIAREYSGILTRAPEADINGFADKIDEMSAILTRVENGGEQL